MNAEPDIHPIREIVNPDTAPRNWITIPMEPEVPSTVPFWCAFGGHAWGMYSIPHVTTETKNGDGVTLKTTFGQTRTCGGCGLIQTTEVR